MTILGTALVLAGIALLAAALIAQAHEVLDCGDYRECRGFEA